MGRFIYNVLCTVLLGAASVGHVPLRTPPVQAPLKTLARPDTATICIVGDLMMHSGQIEEGGWRQSLRLIRPYLEDATLSIANMEFTLAGPPYTGYPSFSAPEDYALTAAENGIDVFLTANNHITDKGKEGLRRTLDFYGSMNATHGIFHTGCDSLASPLFVRADNIRVGIVNATYGTNGGTAGTSVNLLGDRELLRKAVEMSDSLADFTIVLPHWGEEYRTRHNAGQENLAEFIAGAGADIIVGAHPHVVQDTASVTVACRGDGCLTRKVPVIYSLGNALSNMSARDTQLELMARLTAVRDPWGTRLASVELIWLWCSRPGGFDCRYTVVPVGEYIGRKELWMNPRDYEKMVTTYRRIRKGVTPEWEEQLN